MKIITLVAASFLFCFLLDRYGYDHSINVLAAIYYLPPYDYEVHRDCGAKGDGKTDDSAALAQCMAKAGEIGGTLYMTPGDYLVDGINIP